MPKLVAIGDSLTQGVQSGAIFNTQLSFPALIADAMGLNVPNEFRGPRFHGSGLPFNIEWFLRSMRQHLGFSINPVEWRFELPFRLAGFIDEIEDMYERKAGSRRTARNGIYHNLGVAGFRVRDSFTVDANYCAERICEAEGCAEGDTKDNFFGFPSNSMYRIAQRVLNPNPQRYPKRECWTQIDNLQEFKCNKDPVKNLILFLGANDCLEAVTKFKLKSMEDEENVSCDSQTRRKNYTLTSVCAFETDYNEMVKRVSCAISEDTKVFVGTIPHVTIPPITQGISGSEDFECNGQKYFTYYAPFFANERNFRRWHAHITGREARCIDERVDAFNCIIRKAVCGKENWHIVDICALLDSLALKRSMLDDPGAPLRDFLIKRKMPNHELLRLDPIPSVLRFESRDNQWKSGGLFSLDCFHPTTIGYGLIAEEFIHEMKKAGVRPVDSEQANDSEDLDWKLDWESIIEQDSLIQCPPVLWDDIIEHAEKSSTLVNLIYHILT